jgi:hypothetical protein
MIEYKVVETSSVTDDEVERRRRGGGRADLNPDYPMGKLR